MRQFVSFCCLSHYGLSHDTMLYKNGKQMGRFYFISYLICARE